MNYSILCFLIVVFLAHFSQIDKLDPAISDPQNNITMTAVLVNNCHKSADIRYLLSGKRHQVHFVGGLVFAHFVLDCSNIAMRRDSPSTVCFSSLSSGLGSLLLPETEYPHL
jgi:hypothetical protein